MDKRSLRNDRGIMPNNLNMEKAKKVSGITLSSNQLFHPRRGQKLGHDFEDFEYGQGIGIQATIDDIGMFDNDNYKRSKRRPKPPNQRALDLRAQTPMSFPS